MNDKALVVIDIQNDITKNYKEIIGNINAAVDWAAGSGIHVVYIKHNNLSAGTRTFKPDTRGAELVADMKIVSENVFVKSKGNALTSEAFAAFIKENGIKEFFVAGADAVACVKSTCYNMDTGTFTCFECGTGAGASRSTYHTLRKAEGKEYDEYFASADGEKRALRLIREYFSYKTENPLKSLSEYIRLI